MPEPDVPLPDPEENSYWDPHPMRCSEPGCRNILQAKGAGMGWCPIHGDVQGTYSSETENFQFEVEE